MWWLWGGVSLYVGIGWTFLCPGATMLCVCKWTERGQALRISQGPWDELQVFALDVESCWAGGGGGGRGAGAPFRHTAHTAFNLLSSIKPRRENIPCSLLLSFVPRTSSQVPRLHRGLPLVREGDLMGCKRTRFHQF